MGVNEINQNNFSNEVLKNPGTCIVDFYASWCGPCHMQSPIIDEVANELSGKAQVFKVNIDENQALASEFGVQSIPTIKIFKGGREEKTLIGLHDKQAIINAANV